MEMYRSAALDWPRRAVSAMAILAVWLAVLTVFAGAGASPGLAAGAGPSEANLTGDAKTVVETVKTKMPNICGTKQNLRHDAIARVGMALAMARKLQGGAKEASDQANEYFSAFCADSEK